MSRLRVRQYRELSAFTQVLLQSVKHSDITPLVYIGTTESNNKSNLLFVQFKISFRIYSIGVELNQQALPKSLEPLIKTIELHLKNHIPGLPIVPGVLHHPVSFKPGSFPNE